LSPSRSAGEGDGALDSRADLLYEAALNSKQRAEALRLIHDGSGVTAGLNP